MRPHGGASVVGTSFHDPC